MDWKTDLEEARQYSKAAQGLVKINKVDNETLYHIVCLSVEKYLASLSGMVNYMPLHSGLTYVARELGKKMELPPHFIDEVRFMNSFMTYCSLEIEKPRPVSPENMQRMLKFMDEVGQFTINKSGN